MKKQFELLEITRNNILKAIEGLTLNQVNQIPIGFKNNIVWNAAHIVVTQQLLCYKLSGIEMYIENEFVDKYKKGSDVSFEIEEEEFNNIKKQLAELPFKLVEDYKKLIFKNYNEYPTSYNVTLNSIEDAIQFNNVHEGLHFGYIMALKKALN